MVINTVSNEINFAILIALLIIGLICVFQFINLNLGYNIFVPTMEQKINSLISKKQFKKTLTHRYKDIIHAIINFRKKYHLFFASKYAKEDIEITLERNFKKLTPDDYDYLTYEKFSAQNNLFSIIILGIFILPIIFTKGFIHLFLIIILVGILLYINIIRYLLMVFNINLQNEILERNFGDFYLTQHHILLKEKRNPLTKGLSIYKHKAINPYMKQWVESTLRLIKSTTEDFVIDRYLIIYKQIYILCKLFNIEKQIVNGGDCSLLLKGLRDEVIQKRNMDIDDNANKIVTKALIIRNVVFFIVFQVMAGAVIYFLMTSKVEI